MHTEMWEHPAVQENLATLRRRGVHVRRARRGPPGRRRHRRRAAWPSPADRRGRGRLRRCSGAAPATSPGCARRWSPRAAPASRSTRCASSPTAPRASRATPSPRRPRAAGRRGHPRHAPSSRPVAARRAERGRASRRRPRWRRPCSIAAGAADVVVMAAAVADFRPAAAAERKLKKDDGVPEIVLEPTPDILADLGRPAPAGPGARRLRRRDRRRRCAGAPATSSQPRASTSWSPTTSARPGSGFEHDTNAVDDPRRRRRRRARCR